MASPRRTRLAYQHDGRLLSLQTTVISIEPFVSLDEANRQLFKTENGESADDIFAVVTEATVFHPQGGGQPSDVGFMTCGGGDAATTPRPTFAVAAARMDAVHDGRVLHFGRFSSGAPPDDDGGGGGSVGLTLFQAGDQVTQSVDAAKRLLYSRLHTAGHVLGAAVRHLLEKEVPGFDELKASHFPGTAACEFAGAIEGKWKGDIQARVDKYVDAAMKVEIDWWNEEDFKREGLERLIPKEGTVVTGGEKWRVVKIVGAEVYPCGGTHVETTDLCGKTTVKKISRAKGNSRVSYTVA